jgi:hypothetical protein
MRGLRVTVSDVWRTVEVRVAPGTAALELKQRALYLAGLDPRLEGRYELKFGGGVLPDAQRLDAAGVPDGAALVVLPRFRRPVR